MAHVMTGRGTEHREVEAAWLPATARLNDYVARVAGLPRLAVKIGPNMAVESGTAQFSPFTFEIEIDSTVLAPGMRPEACEPTDELFRSKHPLLMGGLLHETFHARYSHWVPRDLGEGEAKGRFTGRKTTVLVALEESRIEKRGVNRYAVARDYLPAIVFDLLAREFKGGDDPFSASILFALTSGRRLAGTIGVRDEKPFRDLAAEQLHDEQMEALEGLITEYHDLRFSKYDPLPLDEMESIANRWLEVLGQDPAEEGEGAAQVLVAHAHEAEEGEGSGEAPGGAEGSDEDESGNLGERAREAAASAKHDKAMQAAEKAVRIMERRDMAERAADAERAEQAEQAHEAVFEQKMVGDGGQAGIRSRVHFQKPDAPMMVAGTVLARKLAQVRLVEPARAKRASQMPGKRLRSRGAIQRRVQEQRGQIPTAKMWERKERHMTDEIPLKVGVAVDISGSMNALAMPLATTAFVVGNAVQKAGGSYAQVAFGAETSGVVKAGRKVTHVPYVRPSDPNEDIKGACLALDGELDLVDGDGVRVLIIASDGHFVKSAQSDWADVNWPLWSKRGVVIIHIDLEGGYVERADTRHNNPRPPLVIDPHLPPTEIAEILGGAIVTEVAKEQARRQAA